MTTFFLSLLLVFPAVVLAKPRTLTEQILPILRGLDSIHIEGRGENSQLAASWRRPHFPTTLTVHVPQVPTSKRQIEFEIQSRSAAVFLQMRSLVDEVSREVSAPDSLALRPAVFPSSRHTENGFQGNMKIRVPNSPAGRNFSAVFLKQFKELSENF